MIIFLNSTFFLCSGVNIDVVVLDSVIVWIAVICISIL